MTFKIPLNIFSDPAVFYSMARLKKLTVRNAPELEIFAVDTANISILSNFFLSSLENNIQNPPYYLFRSSRILLYGTLEETDSA